MLWCRRPCFLSDLIWSKSKIIFFFICSTSSLNRSSSMLQTYIAFICFTYSCMIGKYIPDEGLRRKCVPHGMRNTAFLLKFVFNFITNIFNSYLLSSSYMFDVKLKFRNEQQNSRKFDSWFGVSWNIRFLRRIWTSHSIFFVHKNKLLYYWVSRKSCINIKWIDSSCTCS